MFPAVLDTDLRMTRDFIPRWLIAILVGAGLALLAPRSADDRSLFHFADGAPIPERVLRSPDQPRGVSHHYVVPGKVSGDAVGAAGTSPH